MRRLIGTYRRSPAVEALHELASFVESAYANEGSSFHTNGELALLRKLIPADFKTAIDVGANFGDWTVETLALWPQCRLHAFEVAPLTFKTLTEQVPVQNRDRVVLNCLGLSDQAGTLTMQYFPDHPELTCDRPRHGSYQAIPFEAQLDTGDRYCSRVGIDTVNFLKIDVEGSESRVIQGFGEHFAAQKIHCVQFEYGAFSTQSKFLLGDYYALLGDRYWIGKIYPSYVDFRDYDWSMEDFRFANYFCVSKLRPDLRALVAA